MQRHNFRTVFFTIAKNAKVIPRYVNIATRLKVKIYMFDKFVKT